MTKEKRETDEELKKLQKELGKEMTLVEKEKTKNVKLQSRIAERTKVMFNFESMI